jgi:hypothetical protein
MRLSNELITYLSADLSADLSNNLSTDLSMDLSADLSNNLSTDLSNHLSIHIYHYLSNHFKELDTTYKEMSFDERIQFYLGKHFFNYVVSDRDKFINIHKLPNSPIGYVNTIKQLLNHDSTLLFKTLLGDVEKKVDPITFVKNRWDSTDGVILFSLNQKRHWDKFYNPPIDIPFEHKQNILFWRGATTGKPHYPGNRFDLVKRWFKQNDLVDVGFSKICQGMHSFKHFILDKASEEQFLQFKYILSVRGNDKDSGLQWKLNSNSIVFMPKPTIDTWLMESTLIPNFHYILIKDDFSDILDKIIWCNNHPHLCKQISIHAKSFMRQFFRIQSQLFIQRVIFIFYFYRIHLHFKPR